MPEFDLSVAEFAKSRRTAEPSESERGGAGFMPLQSSMGNAAIARMLQREEAPEEEEVMAKHDAALAQREEAPEEEEVMAKHDPALAQREEAPEEEEVMAKHDQTSGQATELRANASVAQREGAPEVGLAGGGVSDGLANRIDSMRGGGSPLDDNTKSTMEDALGTSMAGVRVHVGSESDSLNHAITAKAFTTGNDVFVRSDQWAPGSTSTQRLMAHELTHVAQQREGIGGSGGGMSVGASDTHEEHEADSVADAVMSRTAQRNTDEEQ